MCMPKDKEPTKRVTVTLTEQEAARVEYWAQQHEMSINEYLRAAIERQIRWENKDYDLPALEIQRLNQLIDGFTVLSSNVKSLEGVVTSGFDSLLGMTRGDNYLLEHEDGEV